MRGQDKDNSRVTTALSTIAKSIHPIRLFRLASALSLTPSLSLSLSLFACVNHSDLDVCDSALMRATVRATVRRARTKAGAVRELTLE